MNFNPDKIILQEQLHPLENDRFLNNLSEGIEKKLSAYRPNPEDFIEIYGEASVKENIEYTENLEKIWEKERNELDPAEKSKKERINKIATITEGIMIDQLSGSWLNTGDEDPNYRIIAHPTSKFDDYCIGADVALEIINNHSNKESHIGLSIDITYSSSTEVIKSKLERVFNEINNKEQPSIKYFENDAETYKGSVDIARCVLVLSKETVADLFKKEHNKDREGLNKHSVQLSIITQIEQQAKAFQRLAKNKGNEKMSKIYQDVLENIKLLRLIKRKEFMEVEDDEISLMDKYDGLKILHESLIEHLLPE